MSEWGLLNCLLNFDASTNETGGEGASGSHKKLKEEMGQVIHFEDSLACLPKQSKGESIRSPQERKSRQQPWFHNILIGSTEQASVSRILVTPNRRPKMRD
ncbi:uncharacterized protein VP01_1841g7 [Puccinia sorghi]|uniref:Uncharacterized protein n=1 Tax=Puccinia sorghi TaxID=27349 RepID=A0A0L6VDU4_9BASI|nr:uncharacterized protein VP01_1841g7 [Puccinia sorghi]